MRVQSIAFRMVSSISITSFSLYLPFVIYEMSHAVGPHESFSWNLALMKRVERVMS